MEFDPDIYQSLDEADPLRAMRRAFCIPQHNAEPSIYFCGNSLGLQPKITAQYVNDFLHDWQSLGVKGHVEGEFPWLPYHEFLTAPMADLVGGLASEVVCMNSLTANLHLMMVSFYRPTPQRHKILIEAHAFPSDHFAVESQIRFHGYDPDQAMQLLSPRAGEEILYTEDILAAIEQYGEELALVMLPGVQYYTGQVLDMAAITEAAHRKGCNVGFDLAHAVGNIPLQLHDWGVDFAVWCTYKYLNSGPGSVGGCFVHERFHRDSDLPRFAGWWGHDKQTRFKMDNHFVPIASVEAWQLSNPPILSLVAIRASLDIFQQAGGMQPLREKSLLMTQYLRSLIENELAGQLSIITPRDTEQSGCQLSLQTNISAADSKRLFAHIDANGVVCDWREPNVIRIAPVPLYNNYWDIYRFIKILKEYLIAR